MPLTRIAIVPAAPLLLAAASPAQPDEIADQVTQLRDHSRRVLQNLPSVGTALLLDAGSESVVQDAPRASLAGYGLPDLDAPIDVDAELLAAVSARGQAPRVRSDRLDGDPAVLALLLADVRPDLAVAPVTVPGRASGGTLADLAMGLRAAIDATGRDIAVVAAGDLSAALTSLSPGYLVDGAEDWDRRAVAAIESGDATAFASLGPDEAARVKARGWAPITVALTLAASANRPVEAPFYLAPRGVGQVVAG